MSNNHYGYKQRVAPNDYLNGPVRVFTKEEIAEWEAGDGAKKAYEKIQSQSGLNEIEIKFLDALGEVQAEGEYAEIMEGVGAGGGSNE